MGHQFKGQKQCLLSRRCFFTTGIFINFVCQKSGTVKDVFYCMYIYISYMHVKVQPTYIYIFYIYI